MDVLLRATEADPYSHIVAGLLLASGRREIEIMNVCSGRARFEPHGDRSVWFEGQAKKPTTEASGYVVPLLCDSGLFFNALEVLKSKRGDVSGLTNAQLKRKMNGNLTSMQLRRAFPTLPDGAHYHTLRSLYFHFVDRLYVHTFAYNELARLLLGHGSRDQSHPYTAVRLEGVDALKGTLGVLSLGRESE